MAPRTRRVLRITFVSATQDFQRLGGEREELRATIRLKIALDGKPQGEFAVTVRQNTPAPFEAARGTEVPTPLQIEGPFGYKGPMDHKRLSEEVEKLYRGKVGSTGSAIRTQGENVYDNVFENNRITFAPVTVEFEVEESGGGW
jgi:hypothetical protein